MNPRQCPQCGQRAIPLAKKWFVSHRKPTTCSGCHTRLYLHTGYEVASRIAVFLLLVPVLLKLATGPSLFYGILCVPLFFGVWFVHRYFVPLRFY